jgi:cullin-4
VQTSIRVLLSRKANETLPAIYEAIFRACQVIVMVYKDGDRLHGALRLELEQCISALATKELGTSKQKGLDWIKELNEVCTWFEKRVVRKSEDMEW